MLDTDWLSGCDHVLIVVNIKRVSSPYSFRSFVSGHIKKFLEIVAFFF